MNDGGVTEMKEKIAVLLIAIVLSITVFGTQDIFAVLIGMGNYASSEYQDLKSPLRDVEAMKTFLTTELSVPSDFILTITDTAYGIASEEIKNFITGNKSYMDPEDIFIFYFTGHGDIYGGNPLLLFNDATSDKRTGILFQDDIVGDLLRDVPAVKMVILDACHQGEVKSAVVKVKNAPDIYVAASTKDEVAYARKNGILTTAVLKAMKPEYSDENGDLKVDMEEFKTSVERIVFEESGSNQIAVVNVRTNVAIDYVGNYGFIEIESEPSDAKIKIPSMGIELTSGKKRPLKAGSYEIEVEKPGYIGKKEIIRVKAESVTKKRVELEKETYVVKISIMDAFLSAVEGAKVTIKIGDKTEELETDTDGIVRYNVKSLPIDLEIEAKADNKKAKATKVIDERSIKEPITLTLKSAGNGPGGEPPEPDRGVIYVNNPQMRKLKIDGESQGRPVTLRKIVEPGRHVVEAEGETKEVTVEKGELIYVEFKDEVIEKSYGYLVIKNPERGRVYIDGEYVTNEAEKDIQLASGEYTVECVKEKFRTFREKISVEPLDVADINIQLEKQKGKVAVELPEGFRLFIDDKEYFKTSTDTISIELDTGEHTLIITKEKLQIMKNEIYLFDRNEYYLDRKNIMKKYSDYMEQVSTKIAEYMGKINLALFKAREEPSQITKALSYVYELYNISGDEDYLKLKTALEEKDELLLRIIAENPKMKIIRDNLIELTNDTWQKYLRDLKKAVDNKDYYAVIRLLSKINPQLFGRTPSVETWKEAYAYFREMNLTDTCQILEPLMQQEIKKAIEEGDNVLASKLCEQEFPEVADILKIYEPGDWERAYRIARFHSNAAKTQIEEERGYEWIMQVLESNYERNDACAIVTMGPEEVASYYGKDIPKLGEILNEYESGDWAKAYEVVENDHKILAEAIKPKVYEELEKAAENKDAVKFSRLVRKINPDVSKELFIYDKGDWKRAYDLAEKSGDKALTEILKPLAEKDNTINVFQVRSFSFFAGGGYEYNDYIPFFRATIGYYLPYGISVGVNGYANQEFSLFFGDAFLRFMLGYLYLQGGAGYIGQSLFYVAEAGMKVGAIEIGIPMFTNQSFSDYSISMYVGISLTF